MTEEKNVKPIAQETIDVTKMNIFEKMLRATADIGYVAKNLNVAVTSSSSYKAVGEVDVLNAVKPIEEKYGIYSYPFDRIIVESDVLESVKYDGKPKKELFVRLETIYRFVNIHKPSEFIDIKSYAEGIDSGDKCSGKAMTYSDKYALMKAYKIQTGDDPDADASGELNGKGKAKKEEPKKETTKPAPQAMTSTEQHPKSDPKALVDADLLEKLTLVVDEATKQKAFAYYKIDDLTKLTQIQAQSLYDQKVGIKK